jgi:hypothetical protein
VTISGFLAWLFGKKLILYRPAGALPFRKTVLQTTCGKAFAAQLGDGVVG